MNKEREFEEFEEIGFKNQAIIKGFKRVELKNFIRKNFIPRSRVEKMRKDVIKGTPSQYDDVVYNKALEDLLKEEK